MINVGMLDDHAIVAHGYTSLIESNAKYCVKFIATSISEAKSLLSNDIDIFMLDIKLNDENGLDIVDFCNKKYPTMSILVASMFESASLARQAFDSGVSAYLSKRTIAEELFDAFDAVLKHEIFISSVIRDGLQQQDRLQTLTNKEKALLRSFVLSDSIKEIAFQTSLADKTIYTHRTNILRKLGLSNRKELIKFAVQTGFVEEEELLS